MRKFEYYVVSAIQKVNGMSFVTNYIGIDEPMTTREVLEQVESVIAEGYGIDRSSLVILNAIRLEDTFDGRPEKECIHDEHPCMYEEGVKSKCGK